MTAWISAQVFKKRSLPLTCHSQGGRGVASWCPPWSPASQDSTALGLLQFGCMGPRRQHSDLGVLGLGVPKNWCGPGARRGYRMGTGVVPVLVALVLLPWVPHASDAHAPPQMLLPALSGASSRWHGRMSGSAPDLAGCVWLHPGRGPASSARGSTSSPASPSRGGCRQTPTGAHWAGHSSYPQLPLRHTTCPLSGHGGNSSSGPRIPGSWT